MIYTKVIDQIQFKDVPEDDMNYESCTVPGAGLTVRDIYQMYARGEMPMPNKAYDEGTELKEEYVPRDPSEAMQMSLNYQRQQVMEQARLQQEQQSAPQEPQTAQNSSEA